VDAHLSAWLRTYPHLATCAECRLFAYHYLSDRPSQQVLSAMLTYHESGHRHDPFLLEGTFVPIT
jgi:hypothetical protein